MHQHGVTFNFGSAQVCSLAMLNTCFSYDKDSCRCATLYCDLDLIFDLAVVTLTYKIVSGLYLRNHKVWQVDT